jgi:hypothetical protein
LLRAHRSASQIARHNPFITPSGPAPHLANAGSCMLNVSLPERTAPHTLADRLIGSTHSGSFRGGIMRQSISREPRWKWLVALLASAAPLAIIVLILYTQRTVVVGTFQAAGPDIGQWLMTTDECQSGEHQGFFGIVLFSSTDRKFGITIVQPPIESPSIAANVPDKDYARVFHADSCALLKVDLHRANSKFNGIWDVYGSVAVDCKADNAHLQGRAELSHCH